MAVFPNFDNVGSLLEDITRWGFSFGFPGLTTAEKIGDLMGQDEETGIGIGVGDVMNELTGVNSSNAYNASQAALDRDWQTQERIATQDYNSAEAAINRQFTSEEAEKARQWSEMMENSAVQRRMNDLRQAGINPMLVASGGLAAGSSAASGATGSAASVSPQSGAKATSSGNSAAGVAAIVLALSRLVGAALA